jgi:3',5'-nucleoside bisphosphate phosphatase
MRRFVDLHTHSTASDGSLAPAALVALADRAGLMALALTDHDTVAGLQAARNAAKAHRELIFIPGIEVSAQFDGGTMHILGLGIDGSSPRIARFAEDLRQAREERNPKILAKLNSMGIPLTMDQVLAVASEGVGRENSGIVSRVHIAEAMRRSGAARSVKDAFERYISAQSPAYVHKWRPAPREAIAVIREAGGMAILAHPVELNCGNLAQIERIAKDLRQHGLTGLEAYHSRHTAERTRAYIDLAKRLGLCVTGGSDFHGSGKPDVQLGRPRVPLAAVTGEVRQRLDAAAGHAPCAETDERL